MPPGVTLITPTGCRPGSLRRCAGFVGRQTWAGPLQWIIVDDGEPPSDTGLRVYRPIELTRIHPEPKWRLGQNTLARNLLAALPEVRYDFLFFFEDDDFYASDYVEEQMRLLGDAQMVGEAPARYYHLPSRRYQQLNNRGHASLCQTGIRREVLPLFRLISERAEKSGTKFIDVQLWGHAGKKVLHDGRRSVGMKGLPGRAGIGVGHRPYGPDWRADASAAVLKSWIGEDTKLYEEKYMSEENPNPNLTESGLETFVWKGQTRYRCPWKYDNGGSCAYDTYDEKLLQDHVRDTHGQNRRPENAGRVSPILDASGQNFRVADPAPEIPGASFKKE